MSLFSKAASVVMPRSAAARRVDSQEMSRESVHNHLREMMATVGWGVMLQYFNSERERIIGEGKSGRASDAQTKMWAVLEGFDRAVLMAEKILKSTETGAGKAALELED